jgi:ribosomal protein S24E
MENITEIKNELTKRNEVSFMIEADKNPNFAEMKKKISEHFKKNEENIDVYGIKGSFGSNNFKVEAHVYDTKEDFEKSRQLTNKQKEAIKKVEEEKVKAEAEKVKAEEEAKKKAEEEAKAATEKPAEETAEVSEVVETPAE